MNRSTSHK